MHSACRRVVGLAGLVICASFGNAAADEAGVSFWLPGQYAAFAAEPGTPGLSFEAAFYHATASAQRNATFARDGRVQAGVKSPSDFVMLTPTYTFDTKILGGQPALGMTALVGRNVTSVAVTLTGPEGNTLSGSRSDRVVGFGDLYPNATLKWNKGVHNFMVYGTAGIPVGAYNTDRLAALGLGHWSVDGGGGYTYYNEKAGVEFSAVAGLTYNFINPYTQYRSGNDFHLDLSFSPYVSDRMHIGAVGYLYNQISADSGLGATLGDFKSRVAGVGPQIGFFLPMGDREGYLNFRAYYEFAAEHRLDGWNMFVTFSIEPPEEGGSLLAARR
jgi:hypothetical protein